MTSPRAQTLSKAKALDELTDASADLLKAQQRVEAANEELNKASNTRAAAAARVDDANAHLKRAIAKEVG